MIFSFPFKDIPNTPSLVKAYLKQENSTKALYSYSIAYENIIRQTQLKNFENRENLYAFLKKQHNQFPTSKKQIQNLELLKEQTTFTITTGHQLNFLSGSVFFIYKILHTIKLCDELNKKQSYKKLVPLFWLASEDHDFEEINHFSIQNKKYTWQTTQKGAVGNFHVEEMKKSLQLFFTQNPAHKKLEEAVENYFSDFQNETLSHFTRFLVNYWFSEYGLLIIDANHSDCKKQMIPYFEKEIKEQLSHKIMRESASYLRENDFGIQVNPREINLFYLHKNGRDRIIKNENIYEILNTELHFTQDEILHELYASPEKFSPNALLRPLYQEVILPNVCYIGGNAEIAYWLELKAYFEAVGVPFPIIIPRNSFFIFTSKQWKQMQEFNWSFTNFFDDKLTIFNQYIQKNTSININFETHKKTIENLYNEMKSEAKKTDSTLTNLLNAQEKKQINAFLKLQKRLLKAERKINEEKWQKFNNLHQTIFPNNSWQERVYNMLHFTTDNHQNFLASIYQSIDTTNPKCICTVFDY